MPRLRQLFLWMVPATLLAATPTPHQQVENLVRAGIAAQENGQQRQAVDSLERAVALAEKSGDQHLLLLAKSSLGAVCTCSRQADQAEKNLRESLALADQLKDPGTAGIVWNNLGNLLAAQGQFTNALAAFDEAARQPGTAIKANANAAAVACRAALPDQAEQYNSAAIAKLTGQPVTADTALLWLRCGTTDLKLNQFARAGHAFRQALTCDAPRVQTYALGELGHLDELQKNFDKALDLTRQAAFSAQKNSRPEALYRWEWQTGRLLAATGQRAPAIAAYRRAVQSLQPIRAALTQGCGAARPSFREAVAPVYYELTDLLLQEDRREGEAPAEPQSGTARREARPPTTDSNTLVEARDTIELLKAAELDDYLQDDCAANARAHAGPMKVPANTAVVFIIPLPDRTEILLDFTTGIERVRVPVTATELTTEVRQFRANLEKRTSNQYLLQARQLDTWLIAPLRPLLAAHAVDTLVFVPDGALRTVPLAALYDGKQFLIEQFALAIMPSALASDPQPMPHTNVRALAAGLSEATQHFGALPNVPEELQTIAGIFHGPVLLNAQFSTAGLRSGFAEAQFQIVHFATHGQLDKDINRSFILTHDGKLTLDDLETLLRPAQFRGQPVELLTLSACQTAAGDDRAALGLAGMAVKAGAHSALATLWFVHDESTAVLMEEFYRGLATASKAKALQQAQIKVLHDPRFDHAGYWAPYLLIGEWL